MAQIKLAHRTFLPVLAAAYLLLAASGWGQSTIQARITGGGGNGKCTFEVRVDGVANVQIRGTRVTSRPRAACPRSGCACNVTSRCRAIPTTFASRVSMDAAGNTCSKTRLPTTAWRSSALKIIAAAWKAIPATSSGTVETITAPRGTVAGGTITGTAAVVGAEAVAAGILPLHPRVAATAR